MKVFIDFDDVIFNTKQFKYDFRGMFLAEGISLEVFDRCYVDPRDTRALKTFDPWIQAERICLEIENLDKDSINACVKKFIQDVSKYVFSDVAYFVNQLGSKNISIVSFGEKQFQSQKIANSGIGEIIPNIIVTQSSKADAIGEIIKNQKAEENEKMFFIDDRLEQIEDVKKNFPFITTLFMKRPDGRYLEQQRNEYCDYETYDLKGALEIIL